MEQRWVGQLRQLQICQSVDSIEQSCFVSARRMRAGGSLGVHREYTELDRRGLKSTGGNETRL